MIPTRPKDGADDRLEHEFCHTVDLGLEGFRECPWVGPNTCRFALPFGYAFLCCQPELQDRQQAATTGTVPE